MVIRAILRTPKRALLRNKISASVVSLCLLVGAVAAPQSNFTREQYTQDFDYLWKAISDDYAYFDQKQTDWNRVREIYRPQIETVKTRNDFVGVLESMLEELYDFHTHLNTNTGASPRLVPSGADIWAEWINGKAFVTEVRPESRAEQAGIRTGMQIIAINGTPVEEAVNRRVGRSLRLRDGAVNDWALRVLLAGRHNQKRSLDVMLNGKRSLVTIDDSPMLESGRQGPLLEYRQIEKSFGYIRIKNSLGDTDLIKQFDDALAALRNTRGSILDLRDTPSGGNTTVARGIMGRFISREMPYQKHSIPAEERQYGTKRSWIELVSPRGEFIYKAPVVVLVNHWTGSMGEGITIGLDGMHRATIVGTKMARLVGATSGVRLPNTGIGVNFPTEKLFHVNGSPREDFVPPVYVDLLKVSHDHDDVILQRGLSELMSRRN